jgi:hypothetical protein
VSKRVICDGPIVKVPAYFFADHLDRGLPTPKELGGGKTYVWIALNDLATSELLDDALFYSDPYGPGAGDPEYRGLRATARGVVKAIKKAMALAEGAKAGAL